jgi:thioredoxin-like negative regulator of GroEL
MRAQPSAPAHGGGRTVVPVQTAPTAPPSVPSEDAAKPRLVFFHSTRSGPSRRVEGFLAQVLQRRGNHNTFRLHRVATEERPDLVSRFAVDSVPTLVVVDGKRVRARLVKPRGCEEIEQFLAPWLT